MDKPFRFHELTKAEAAAFVVTYVDLIDSQVDAFRSALEAIGGPAELVDGEGADGLVGLWEWYLATYVESDSLPLEEAGYEFPIAAWVVRFSPAGDERRAVTSGLASVLDQRLVRRFGRGVFKLSVNNDPCVGDSLTSPNRLLGTACVRLFELLQGTPLQPHAVGLTESGHLVSRWEFFVDAAEKASPGSVVVLPVEDPWVRFSGAGIEPGETSIELDGGVSWERRGRFVALLEASPEFIAEVPVNVDRAHVTVRFRCGEGEIKELVLRSWRDSAE